MTDTNIRPLESLSREQLIDINRHLRDDVDSLRQQLAEAHEIITRREAVIRQLESDIEEIGAGGVSLMGRDAQAAEIAELRQRWISVGDRLPETEEPVLIFTPSYPSCPIAIDCWRMQHESPVGWSSATVETGMAWDDHEFEEVSHWMPLPAAPCAALSGEGK